MRILGFSKEWDKLQQEEFTTFRQYRKDKDWYENEVVQVVYKPRSKEREVLGAARITQKEHRHIEAYSGLSNEEAKADGFSDRHSMLTWMRKTHGHVPVFMNKLTLKWIGEGFE